MRCAFAAVFTLLVSLSSAQAHGLLIPSDKTLPPLAMVHHRVNISIEDQVAVTKVEQSFRNHTNRQLEATFIFPIPKGASVNKFAMWIDGKEQAGELLDAKKASQVYTDIVRRTNDPGILEYIGNDLMRLKVFPILPNVDQKVSLSFTYVAPQDNGVVEYTYPMKTDGKATRTLEEFSIKATIKSQHPIQNIYSPTHAVTLNRKDDKEVSLTFERNQATLDKDFQLFYGVGSKEIGITPLAWRPITSEDGYFMLLVSPQIEAAKNAIPSDMVLVMDTSGSMDAVKMEQARKAIKHCLKNLKKGDRFGVVSFATNVRRYRDTLVEANSEYLDAGMKWVDGLRAGGGTAIQSALDSALEMRTKDEGRSFTVIFFTDGQPTIGEMKPENILKNVKAKNTANTRIFTFGVGDDVNTSMLDQLAESTRAVSTYVRPAEDIEMKVTSLNGKISHPVLANVRLTTSENIRISEVYPPQIPDLFFGSQLVVLGRYSGDGPAAVKLTGYVGKEQKEFAYDLKMPAKTSNDDREFVEHLWARRKVGYLLDQIRANGEQKELMEEMMTLAKKYGIATPYTSHLVVPDSAMPVVPPNGPPGGGFINGPGRPGALAPQNFNKDDQKKVLDFARETATGTGGATASRGKFEGDRLQKEEAELKAAQSGKGDSEAKALKDAETRIRSANEQIQSYNKAKDWLARRDMKNVQSGQDGVNLAVYSNNLRNQERMSQTANRVISGRSCLELGGVWIDEGYRGEMKTLTVKAQSEAYFRILEKQPQMKDLYRLGNHLVFVTPSKTALIIDTTDGVEKLKDEEIDALFTVLTK